MRHMFSMKVNKGLIKYLIFGCSAIFLFSFSISNGFAQESEISLSCQIPYYLGKEKGSVISAFGLVVAENIVDNIILRSKI